MAPVPAYLGSGRCCTRRRGPGPVPRIPRSRAADTTQVPCRGYTERQRSLTLEPARSAGRMSCRRDGAAGSMLDRLVLCLVGRFPRAARPVHIGFSIRIWIRLIPLCVRPVGIRAICHEHQRANDNDCQLCFHDDALCQAIQVVEGPGLARGGHRGRPGPGSMRGSKSISK
jgi:hypothetical protein